MPYGQSFVPKNIIISILNKTSFAYLNHAPELNVVFVTKKTRLLEARRVHIVELHIKTSILFRCFDGSTK